MSMFRRRLLQQKAKTCKIENGYSSLGYSQTIINDISNVLAMFVDGVQVTPSTTYNFGDTYGHQVVFIMNTEMTDASRLFYGCSTLEYSTCEGDFTKLETMSEMYGSCSSLIVPILNGDFGSVVSMNGMFSSCGQLTRVDFSGVTNSASLANMAYMFQYCHNLQTCNLSGLNTSSVTSMAQLFEQCFVLTTYYIPDTSNVSDMTSMFAGCYALTGITSMDTSNVEYMSSMFSGCIKLPSFRMAELNTSKVKYMNGMFGSCNKLASVDFTGIDASKVTTMSSMFDNCAALTTVVGLGTLNMPNLTSMYRMFYYCGNLESVEMPVTSASLTDMSYMFRNCSDLKTLDLTSLNTSGLLTLNSAFMYCSSLTTIDFTGLDLSKVTDMGSTFMGTYSLSTLTGFESMELSSVTTMNRMFYYSDISTVEFQSSLSSIADMQYMFDHCSSLTSVKMAGSINLTASVSNMFNGVTTTGIFEYNSSYDYNLIINQLPSTWTAQPIN